MEVIEQDAECPGVHLEGVVDIPLLEELGGHVVGCPAVDLCLGEGGGKPEVNEFDFPGCPEDNIISFDVSMRYPQGMQVPYRPTDANPDFPLLLLRQRIPVNPDKLLQSPRLRYELEQQMYLQYHNGLPAVYPRSSG